MHGQTGLSILSVGEGDTRLKVDPEDPASRERFTKVVTDLLRKGYLISVVTGHDEEGREIRARVTEFDPEALEYLVENTSPEEDEALQQELKGTRGRRRTKRLAIANTPADAVPPTAGGSAPELLWDP
ncbi:MAG: hypothetical protein JSR66_09890 [Proteobacteria bacterium]|nr:hypothetical protein [Pseudomonadota bacterium]